MKINLLKNYQLISALLLIIFIPVSLLVYNSFFINKFRTLMNNELMNKAALSLDAIINNQPQIFADSESAQRAITNIVTEVNKDQYLPSIQSLDLLLPEKDNFKIAATIEPENIGKLVSDPYYDLGWKNNFIAFNTAAGSNSADQTLTQKDRDNQLRYAVAAKTIQDSEQNKIGLLVLKIPTREVDDYLSGVISWSNLILAAIIFIILISILSNSQLFKYAYLFENLKETSKLKDEFISIGSHELRAPLVLIRGNADLAEAALKQNDTQKSAEFIQEISSSAKRLHNLVEDMLEVSRIEQGRMKFNFTVLEPIPIIKEIIKQFTDQYQAKKLTINFNEPEAEVNSLKINVDPDRFKQVLVNLTSNALKYTLKGGLNVTVSKADRKTLAIKFKDTGVGMNAKQREKLFQKFYRVGSEQTREVVGTGLGLWITKMITEAMKGEIMVDSIEGVGTEMTLSFPINS